MEAIDYIIYNLVIGKDHFILSIFDLSVEVCKSCWFLEFNFLVTYFFLECRKYFVQNYIEQIKNPMTFLRTVICIILGTFQKVDSQGIFYSPSFLISILVFLKNYCTNLMHRKCHYEDFALNMLEKFSTKFIFKTLQLTRS